MWSKLFSTHLRRGARESKSHLGASCAPLDDRNAKGRSHRVDVREHMVPAPESALPFNSSPPVSRAQGHRAAAVSKVAARRSSLYVLLGLAQMHLFPSPFIFVCAHSGRRPPAAPCLPGLMRRATATCASTQARQAALRFVCSCGCRAAEIRCDTVRSVGC